MDYLHSIDEQAESMYDTLMKGYQKSWNITEELKATDQMKWVQMMNLARAEAENIIVREIVYGLKKHGYHHKRYPCYAML